jgi:hypothetical protein
MDIVHACIVYTYTPIYICILHAYIHTHTYIYIRIYSSYNPSLLRAAIPSHVGARACACQHVCAHTRAHPAAHSGPHRIDDDPPSAPPVAEKAAHTEYSEVIDAVFHAPMSGLNADAD